MSLAHKHVRGYCYQILAVKTIGVSNFIAFWSCDIDKSLYFQWYRNRRGYIHSCRCLGHHQLLVSNIFWWWNSVNFARKTNALVVVECSWNVYRKILVLKCLFNKVAGLQDCSKTFLFFTSHSRFYFSLGKTLKNFINFL